MIPKGLPPLVIPSAASAPGAADSSATAPSEISNGGDAFVAAPSDPATFLKLTGAPASPLLERAHLDAAHVAGVARVNPELAAKQFRTLLDNILAPSYRSALAERVAATSPAVVEQALKHELDHLNKLSKHERGGIFNAVSNFFLDTAASLGIGSPKGEQLDLDVKQANDAYQKLEAKGPIDAAGAERMQALLDRGVKDAKAYHDLKGSAGRTVGGIAATVASLALGPEAGLVEAGLAAAAAHVGTKALVQGEDYDLSLVGRDAIMGFVSGAAGNRVRALNPGEKVAEYFRVGALGTHLIAGAVDGATTGAINGATVGGVDPEVWKQGVGAGLLAVAQRAASGLAVGMASGATVGVASRLFTKAPSLETKAVIERKQGFSVLTSFEQEKLRTLLQGAGANAAHSGAQAVAQATPNPGDALGPGVFST